MGKLVELVVSLQVLSMNLEHSLTVPDMTIVER